MHAGTDARDEVGAPQPDVAAAGWWNRRRRSNSVVFPAPLGPMSPTISPWLTPKLTSVEDLAVAEAQGDGVDGEVRLNWTVLTH